jgi:hypothetical protein
LIEDPGFNERKQDWPQIHEFNGKTIENSYISRMNSNNEFPDIVKSDITQNELLIDFKNLKNHRYSGPLFGSSEYNGKIC